MARTIIARLRGQTSVKEPDYSTVRAPFAFGGDIHVFRSERLSSYITARGCIELDVLIDTMRIAATTGRLGTYVDVGANIGNHSLAASFYFERVIAFEPNPRAYALLSKNARRRTNIHTHQVGLSDSSGMLPFEEGQNGNLGGSGFHPSGGTHLPKLPIKRGDDVLAPDANIDFIKIDVETHEPRVISGLERTIDRCRPIIDFELNGCLPGASEAWRTISDALPGYRFFHNPAIDTRSAYTITRRLLSGHLTRLAPVIVPELKFYSSIVAVPSEHIGDLAPMIVR